MKNTLALVFGAGLLGGCAPVYTSEVRVGRLYPALPEATPVTFSQAPPQELTRTSEQVGAICASQPSELERLDAELRDRDDNETKRYLAVRARALGGNVVAVVGTCALNNFSVRANGMELGVFRSR